MAATIKKGFAGEVFYENKGIAGPTLRDFCRLKKLCKGTLPLKSVRRAITRFEKTNYLRIQFVQCCKSTNSDGFENLPTATVER